jgi:hypothetical protein
VALKVPLLAPASIVTVAGIKSVSELLDRLMITGALAAFVSTTVQAATCPLLRVSGAQLSADSWAEVERVSEKVCEFRPAVAVMTAV